MDPEASERLRRLQLADLGTARRERISTAQDPRKQVPVHLAYIEATRESNITGTKAQRLAEENKGQLEEWKNLHKTVNDTGDVEDLNDILQAMSFFTLIVVAITRCLRRLSVVEAVSLVLEDEEFSMGPPTMELPPNHIHEPPMPQLHRSIWTLLLTPTTVLLLALIAVRGLSEEMAAKNEVMRAEGQFQSQPFDPPDLRITDYSRYVSTPQAFLDSIHSPAQPPNLSPATTNSPTQRSASVAIAPEAKRPPPSFRPEISIPVTVPVNPKAKVPKALAATTAPSAVPANATQLFSITVPSYPKTAEARATVHLPDMATATATTRSTPPSVPVEKEVFPAKQNTQMKYPVELLLAMQAKAEWRRQEALKATNPEDQSKDAMQHFIDGPFQGKKATSEYQATQGRKAEQQEKARAAEDQKAALSAKEQASRTSVDVLQRQVALLARAGAAQAPMTASRAGRAQRSDSEATSMDTSESVISYPKPMLSEEDNFPLPGSSGHLVDVEVESMPQSGLTEHVLSPALVDLTGLDFSTARLHDTVEKEPSIPATPSVSSEDTEQQRLSESVPDIEKMLDPRLVAMSKLVDEFLKQMNDYRREFETHVTKALSSPGRSHSTSQQIIATPEGSSPVIMHTSPGSPVQAPTTPIMTRADEITEMQKWLSQSGAISRDAAINHPSFSRYRSPVRIPSSGTDSPPEAQELPGTPSKTAFSANIPTFDTLRVSESPDRAPHTFDPVKKPEPAVKESTVKGPPVSETLPPVTSPKIKSPGVQTKKQVSWLNKSIYAAPGVPLYTGPPLYTAVNQPIDQPLGKVTEFGKTKVLGVAPFNPSARVASLSQRSHNIPARDLPMPDAPEQAELHQLTSASSGEPYQSKSSLPTVLGPKPFTIPRIKESKIGLSRLFQ
ncbi:uncharacterized protein PFLUO_LOCUS8154 [Penicillium psychrofluorescens]|uniref:uncharacterized protein n=1 Tax=Penicillium psychrofluorescens TaxID=3158075 RepID=UPI003CCD7BDB